MVKENEGPSGTLLKYRCYLLDGEHIRAVAIIEAPDDGAAQLQAGRMLQESSYASAELWDRDRKVSTISKDQVEPV